MKLLNAMRQVMTQQAVFTIHVKHFYLEQKSNTIHFDTLYVVTNSVIISKQADDKDAESG